MSNILNHLKRGESLADKQMVIISSSENTDESAQSSSSFTYEFNEPILRVAKIDMFYANVPKTFYNVNNDDATMVVSTDTFTETRIDKIIINSDDLADDIINATNEADGTVAEINLALSTDNVNFTNIVTKNAFVYAAGTFDNDTVNFQDFTGASSGQSLFNGGNTDIFVVKYTLEQILSLRFRIAGDLNDTNPYLFVSDDHIYVTGLFTSLLLVFYNSSDAIKHSIVSDGNITSFVASYTVLGEFEWAFKIIGTSSFDNPTIAMYDDQQDKIYISGTYTRDLGIYDTIDSDYPVDEIIYGAGWDASANSPIITDSNTLEPNAFIVTADGSTEIDGENTWLKGDWIVFDGLKWQKIIDYTDGNKVFVMACDTTGLYEWVTKIETNCVLRSMIMQNISDSIAPSIMMGVEFTDTITLYDYPVAASAVTSVADGNQNVALVEYNIDGTALRIIKIGGSNTELNIVMDISRNYLSIVGYYTSNPLNFYDDTGTQIKSIDLDGLTNNIFIVRYEYDATGPTFSWANNIFDKSGDTAPLSVSIDTSYNTLISGNYNSLMKFNNAPLQTYVSGQDLINETGINYSFMAKYSTAGVLHERSYIESDGYSIATFIDAHSNNAYICGYFQGTSVTLYSSDGGLRVITPSNTSDEGFVLSYIENINNYLIDTTTLSTRIICKRLVGTDLRYTITLNSLAQQFGLIKSTQLQPSLFGTTLDDLVWTNDELVVVAGINDTLTIEFLLGEKDNEIFTTTTVTFTIRAATYTTYNLATELSSVIYNKIRLMAVFINNQDQMRSTATKTFAQDSTFVTYNDEKNIYYIIINVVGTFRVLQSTLATEMSFDVDEYVNQCVITVSDIASDAIIVSDNSQITLKLDNTLSTTIHNNVSFSTAFPTVSQNSGSIFIRALQNENMSLITGNTSDDISADIEINDNITFDTPWISADRDNIVFNSVLRWRGLAMSADGLYQTAVVYDGYIYITNTQGETWINKASIQNWESVAMTADGQYQTAVSNGGQIYVSVDFGNIWTPKESPRNWRNVAVARANGAIQVAVAQNDHIYVSVDYGSSWFIRDELRNWESIATNTDGLYMTAVVFGGNIYRSTDTGDTWDVIAGTLGTWQSIDMSASGELQIAINRIGSAYISPDYGASWVVSIVNNGAILSSVRVNKDTAQYQVIVGNTGDIYTSDDSGVTWVGHGFRESWTCVAVSDDGTFQTAAASRGGIYQSGSTAMDTWIELMEPKNWVSVAMSSNGLFQMASVADNVYSSSDAGITWDGPTSLSNAGTLAMSANGKYRYTTVSGGMWKSGDYGVTWATISLTYGASGIAVSSSGKYVTAAPSNDGSDRPIQYSSDFGVTFDEETTLVGNYRAAAMSADGSIQTCVGFHGGVDISYNYGITWTRVTTLASCFEVNMSIDGVTQIIGSNSIYVSTNSGENWISVLTSNESFTGCDISSDGLNMVACESYGELWQSKNQGVLWTTIEESHRWSSVAMSSDGITQAACVYGGSLYKSTNLGDQWKRTLFQYGNPFNAREITDVSISETGQYMMYVANGYDVFISNNYGTSFFQQNLKNLYVATDMTPDGQYMTALYSSGSFFIGGVMFSSDFGNSFAFVQSIGVLNQDIAIAIDGGVAITFVNQNGIGGGEIYSYDGATFVDEGAADNAWTCIACSDDNQVRYAGSTVGIYKSTGGALSSWVLINGSSITSITCSADGVALSAVVATGIITSSDSGVSWSAVQSYTTDGKSQVRIARAQSGGVFYQGFIQGIDAADRGIYLSTDEWATSETHGAHRQWRCIDVSYYGKNQIAGVYPGYIYVSFDYGSTWSMVQDNMQSRAVAVSGSGDIQTIVSSGRHIYNSSTGGQSWSSTNWVNAWRHVDIASTTGLNQIAVPYNGVVYTTADAGITWVETGPGIFDWGDIAISADGTTMMAGTSNTNELYISSDTGATWPLSLTAGGPFQSTASDETGTIMAAVASDQAIYVTDDGGVTWNQYDDARAWQAIDMSASGDKIIAVEVGGRIHYSEDSGLTWSATESNRAWQAISISQDGLTRTAVVFGGQIYVSNAEFFEWVAYETDRDWVSVSISADGIIQSAVTLDSSIFISIDGGITWGPQHTIHELSSVSISDSGVIQAASARNGTLYISTDSGAVWSHMEITRDWRKIAINGDSGGYQTAVAFNDYIYRSDTSGLSWDAVGVVSGYTSIDMSDDGKYQTAVGDDIYVSDDFGASWTAQAIVQDWSCVSVGSDGVYQIAMGSGIYSSDDSGATWSNITFVLFNQPVWLDVAINTAGDIAIAIDNTQQLWVGTGSSLAWTVVDELRNWSSVAMTTDGITQIAAVNGGQIYASSDSGVTWSSMETDQIWEDVTITGTGDIQMGCNTNIIFIHNFDVNQQITFDITEVISDPLVLDTTTTSLSSDTQINTLHDFNLANANNFNIIRRTDPDTTNIFVPPGDYTPTTLVTTINDLLSGVEPSFVNAFAYDAITKKMSFTSYFSGVSVLYATGLLERMGFEFLPNAVTADEPIVADNAVNPNLSGPQNIYLKSDYISTMRKHTTPYYKNSKLENVITPLVYDATTDAYGSPHLVEIFLNQKENIPSIDIQLVDDNGNIVNLNGGTVQINFYFVSS
jgi:photosystem II stability/assembly factor-like uncharacterized protein